MCWTSAYKKGGAYSKALLSSWCMFGNETALNIRCISQARFLFYFGVFCCSIFPTSDFLIESSCVLFLVSQSDLCIHPVLSPPQPFVILCFLFLFDIFKVSAIRAVVSHLGPLSKHTIYVLICLYLAFSVIFMSFIYMEIKMEARLILCVVSENTKYQSICKNH